MKYSIIGTSKYGTEVIDTAKDLKEAKYLVEEYQSSFGYEWRIYYKLNTNEDG